MKGDIIDAVRHTVGPIAERMTQVEEHVVKANVLAKERHAEFEARIEAQIEALKVASVPPSTAYNVSAFDTTDNSATSGVSVCSAIERDLAHGASVGQELMTKLKVEKLRKDVLAEREHVASLAGATELAREHGAKLEAEVGQLKLPSFPVGDLGSLNFQCLEALSQILILHPGKPLTPLFVKELIKITVLGRTVEGATVMPALLRRMVALVKLPGHEVTPDDYDVILMRALSLCSIRPLQSSADYDTTEKRMKEWKRTWEDGTFNSLQLIGNAEEVRRLTKDIEKKAKDIKTTQSQNQKATEEKDEIIKAHKEELIAIKSAQERDKKEHNAVKKELAVAKKENINLAAMAQAQNQ
jgi:hypothetical protein